MEMNSFYFSRILDNKIYDSEKNIIGRLKDLGIMNELRNPKVVVVKAKTSEGIKYLGWESFVVNKINGQYELTCKEIKEKNADNVMFLRKHVLDQQIVDVNGRKVVRVNDIRLALLSNGISVIAVDIGIDGLLRRIGIAKVLKHLKIKTPSKLMLWNNVETIFPSNENIKLSKTYDKLKILHPADLADIIEDFDGKSAIEIFNSLDNAKAADVLEQMEDDAQVSLIQRLSPDKAADILEEMPADEVADILDGLSDVKAEELLRNMEKEASDEVRELMEYEDNQVGSLMNTDYVYFIDDLTVEKCILSLRQTKPEEDQMYNIYVVDNKNKLEGTITLRDLIVSESDKSLKSIMNKEYICMKDTDKLEDLIKNISKYNLVAIPVVDEEKELVGNVIINDIIYELLKNKRRIG
ncbi:MAG TPA: CBS domain-containing protein [Clostridiaceae bacterium]